MQIPLTVGMMVSLPVLGGRPLLPETGFGSVFLVLLFAPVLFLSLASVVSKLLLQQLLLLFRLREQSIRLSLLVGSSVAFLSDRFELRDAFFQFSDFFCEQGKLDVAIG